MISISEEIKQKQFENIYEEASVNFLFTHGWLDRQVKAYLAPFQTSPQQFNVMRILKGAHPQFVSAGYITERMLDKSSNVTRLVDKLLEKQWVVREVCPTNRRKMDIRITSLGIEKLQEMNDAMSQDRLPIQKLTKDEAHIFNQLLNKLRE